MFPVIGIDGYAVIAGFVDHHQQMIIQDDVEVAGVVIEQDFNLRSAET